MRSSSAQRLLGSFFASTSGRGGAALPSAWPAAAEAASTCSLPVPALPSARTLADWAVQFSRCRAFLTRQAAPSTRWLGLDHRLPWAGQPAVPVEQGTSPTQQHHRRCLHASPAQRQDFVTLNNLADNEGARRWVSELM